MAEKARTVHLGKHQAVPMERIHAFFKGYGLTRLYFLFLVKLHSHRFVVTHATLVTALPPAVRSDDFSQPAFIFLPKVVFAHTAIQMRPGEHLIWASNFLAVRRKVDARFCKRLLPEIGPQLLSPAIESATKLLRSQNYFS